MIRARTFVSLTLLLPALAACNAEDPLRPESFQASRTYGQWKMAAAEGSCAPSQIQMTIGPFARPDQVIAHVIGSWFLDGQNPPQTTQFTGEIDRATGEASFRMHPQREIDLTGVFFAHDEFMGGWHDATTDCTARLRGLKID